MNAVPKLYIKPRCSWCRKALAFFSQHGVELDVRDVAANRSDLQRMIEVSGQTLTPTFELEDFIVADFSIDEFLDELNERPEIRRKLGFGDHDEEY